MKKPLITAIIPTYKRPKLLKRAVRSFLMQTFCDFEVLIADNSSGKETDDAIKDLMDQDPRVKLLQHSTNIGLTATFQSALMHVFTPYVCFLCDDDFVTPYFFEETLSPFESHPDIAFSGGGCLMIDQLYTVKSPTANNQSIIPSGYYPPPKGYFAYLHSTFGIGLASLLIKTDILKSVGGFDLRIRNGTDEDPISKCAVRHPVYILTERPYAFGFQHDSNLSGKIDFPLFQKECKCLHENLISAPFSPEEREEVDFFFEKREHKILSSAYDHFCKNKEFVEASQYARKLNTLFPSRRWKRKEMQADLYNHFPFLNTLYTKMKTVEKSVRHVLKRKESHVESNVESHIPSDAAEWKSYALKLEEEMAE